MEASPQLHANPRFEAELRDLRADLGRMGEVVGRQIAAATEALVERDSAKARQTIARDAEVNRLDLEIDDRCLRLLALYQPTAGDLRFVTSGLKLTTDLERIGDNAVNVCECVLELNRTAPAKVYSDVARMAAMAGAMVTDAVQAFSRYDAGLAEAITYRDREVDRLQLQLHHELLSDMAVDPHCIPYGTQLLLAIRYFERIADHATNIAEMVIFMTRGKLIRHMDMNRRQTPSAALS